MVLARAPSSSMALSVIQQRAAGTSRSTSSTGVRRERSSSRNRTRQYRPELWTVGNIASGPRQEGMTSFRLVGVPLMAVLVVGCDVEPGADGSGAEPPEEAVTLTTQPLIGPSDVGVIAPADMNCPNEHVM